MADSIRWADPDLWGHIRFGQAVLSRHHLVLHDVYSYAAYGHLWRNHEWLSEVVMAALYDEFGVIGLKLWKFAAAAATMVLLALGAAETGAARPIQVAVLAVAAVALSPQIQFRPQLFTFAMLAALMLILARDNYRRPAPLWLAVPMLALWANLHGGFIIGLAALATYSVFAIARDFAQGDGAYHAVRLGLVTAGAAIGTLATPYGLDTWRAVLHALFNPMTRLAVADWQPLYAAIAQTWRTEPGALVYYACVFGMLLALAYATARAPRAADLPLLAVAVLMAVAMVVSTRNMALFVIAALGPVARRLAILIGVPLREGASVRRDGFFPSVIVALALALCLYTGLFSRRLGEDIAYPAGAVGFLAEHHLHGNILCDFNWGEFLIWNTAPRSKVFIDGRYDTVYPLKVIRDYLEFYFAAPDAARVLKQYPHDFVLVPPDSGGARVTAASPQWKLVYRDPVSLLFARADSRIAAMPGIPVSGSVPRNLFP